VTPINIQRHYDESPVSWRTCLRRHRQQSVISARSETAALPRYERQRLQGRRPMEAVVTGMVGISQRQCCRQAASRSIRVAPIQLTIARCFKWLQKLFPKKTDHTYNVRPRRHSLSFTVN